MKSRIRYASLDYAVYNEKQTEMYQPTTHRLPMVFGENVYVPNLPTISSLLYVQNGELILDRIHLISLGQLENSDVGQIQEVDFNIYQHGTVVGSWDNNQEGTINQIAYDFPHDRIAQSYKINSLGLVINPTNVETILGLLSVVDTLGFRQNNGVWEQVSLNDDNLEYVTYILNNTTEFLSLATVRSIITIKNCCDFNSKLDAIVTRGKSHRRLITSGVGIITQNDINTAIANGATNLINASLKQLYILDGTVPTVDEDTFWYTYRISNFTDNTRYPDVINYLGSARSGGLNQQINPDILFDYDGFISANIHTDNENLYYNGVICSSLFYKPIELRYLINNHAKWFDLIPYRKENRLGFYPATLSPVNIKHLFTTINQRQYERFWLDFTKHQINSIHVEYVEPTTHDYIGVESLNSVDPTEAYVTELYSAIPVQNNRTSLLQQLPRIMASINSQSQCVSFYTTWSQLDIEIGDYAIIKDPSDTLDLSIIGYISSVALGTNNNLYPISFSFEIDRSTSTQETNNTYTFEANTPVSVGDWVINITQSKYSQVTSLILNTDNTVTVNLIDVVYNSATNIWNNSGDNFLVLKGDNIILVSLSVSSNTILFYENINNVPTLTSDTGRLDLFPTNGAIPYRVIVQFDNFTGSIIDNSPYYQGETPLVWRIASIEPIEAYLPTKLENISYLTDKRDRVVSNLKFSRRNKVRMTNSATTEEGYRYGYRVQATLANLTFSLNDTQPIAT